MQSNSLTFISIKLFLCSSFTDITYLQLATKKILENITPSAAILHTVESLRNDPESAEMIAIINYVKDRQANVKAETINEDPDWFEDAPASLTTKEAVLKRSAKERVRSYFHSSKDFINNAVSSLEFSRDLQYNLDIVYFKGPSDLVLYIRSTI